MDFHFVFSLLVHDVWFLSCLAEHWQDQRDLPAEAAHIKQFQRCLNCVKEVSLDQRLFNYADDNLLINRLCTLFDVGHEVDTVKTKLIL